MLAAILNVGAGLAAEAPPDPALVVAGAETYHNRCSPCHGEALRNQSGGESFDLRKLQPDERDRFFQSVLGGKDKMPAWQGLLKTDEIESIWAYIRSINDRK
jgi:mono/diheme cytochrome c family protein